ncbi:MAG: FixG Ig-like domain-containing protein, partial [Nanoarchaeota archaeon]
MTKGILSASIAFIALLLISLIIGISAAEDFTFTSDLVTNSACPGSTILITLNVKNTGAEESTFSILKEGDAAKFTTMAPSSFLLKQGESKQIFIYVTPTSQISPGSYTLRINIKTSSISKVYEQNIIVENCRATSLQLVPEKNVCQGQSTVLDATLRNDGNFIEDYTIGLEGRAAPWATSSISRVTLGRGESRSFAITVNAPTDAEGTYDLIVKAESLSGARASASSKVIAEVCYAYSFTAEKNFYSLCENEKLSVPIQITNLGKDNDFRFELTGPKWSSIDRGLLTLQAGQSGTANLILAPPYRAFGRFDIDVNTISQQGNLRKRLDMEVNVNKCYDVLLSLEKTSDIICSGLSNSYTLRVRNTGNFLSSYSLSVKGPEWISLEKNTVSIEPGQETNVKLIASPPENTASADYFISLEALDPLSTASSTASLKLSTLSQSECYKPSIVAQSNAISIGKDTTGTISFNIENSGAREATYLIALTGNAASFSQINPSTLKLA